jgi:hypothetical protein
MGTPAKLTIDSEEDARVLAAALAAQLGYKFTVCTEPGSYIFSSRNRSEPMEVYLVEYAGSRSPDCAHGSIDTSA